MEVNVTEDGARILIDISVTGCSTNTECPPIPECPECPPETICPPIPECPDKPIDPTPPDGGVDNPTYSSTEFEITTDENNMRRFI